MSVELKGASARALTAGILLLSRARSFGLRLEVSVVGDVGDVADVHGPALVVSPVLSSCGVGREAGEGTLVVVPGPATDPLFLSLVPDGLGPWFAIDRAGVGLHPATAAFVRLCRDPRPEARLASGSIRRACAAVGVPPEPALLDLLFGAPAPPLTRLALALRAGRAMRGGTAAPITRFLIPGPPETPDPIPSPVDAAGWQQAVQTGQVTALLELLAPGARASVHEWLDVMEALARAGEDNGELLYSLAEITSHLVPLTAHGMLPKLDPTMDAVASGLHRALGATRGGENANRSLVDTYRFLGGRFVQEARYPVTLEGPPPPADRLERWAWFCQATRQAADRADALWRRVMDPVQ